MAKGNLFQGMARGKVGDVVFYRMNGVQMSRVRNRAPKNPRSVEQLYQRAIIASVMKMYSAGKEILDHSFQGYTVGEGCMRRFNSVNARILREQVVDDVNNQEAIKVQKGRLVGPKSLSYTPMIGAMISEGTLEQTLFTYEQDLDGYPPGTSVDDAPMDWQTAFKSTDVTDGMTANQLLKKYGVYAGDIFTFCIGTINTDSIVYQMLSAKMNYTTVYKSYFEWIRFIVKSDIPDTIMAKTMKYSDIFDIESNAPNITFNAGSAFSGVIPFKPVTGIKMATCGCIRSRLDVDLRSTSYMVPYKTSEYGLVSSYVIEAWRMDITKVGTSDLILEGGDEAGISEANLMNLDNTPIIEAAVDEEPVPIMARHKGTRNNKK